MSDIRVGRESRRGLAWDLAAEDGKVVFTRPLCAYPRAARYKGSGDPSKAESFTCR